ncbi:unnamed protein product [Peronospora belbahrii]|uniref:HSF-type DNA-binding domain-containing protein n=1 Tax=Peronospora belbahrii TaxID=622444 RepID=A0AAU9KWV1_9STRA|nr:unnamed protein product [Peronospora belbahrii]
MNVHDLLTNEVHAVSHVTSVASCSNTSSDSSSSSSLSSEKSGWVAPFLLHLHQLLRREDSKIIRWVEDGMAFQILDKAAMTSQVLPKYFKNKNFSSFQRQLNYFGFRKWSKARAQFPTYSREHFKRDNFSEMLLVKRQSKKSRKRKSLTNKEMSVKRAALMPIYCTDKFKPILPRPDGNLQAAMAVRIQDKPCVMSPLMQSATLFNLPLLSPSRKMNHECKLPSIHELSLSSTVPYTVSSRIRSRLMA